MVMDDPQSWSDFYILINTTFQGDAKNVVNFENKEMNDLISLVMCIMAEASSAQDPSSYDIKCPPTLLETSII